MNRLLGFDETVGARPPRRPAGPDPTSRPTHTWQHDDSRSRPDGDGHLAQVFAQYPIEVAHGEGVWLHARDGRKILDFYGGHAVAGLGYGHPRWLAALERQARQMAFQTNALPMAFASGPPRAWSNSRASGSTPCSGSTAAPRPTRTRSSSRSRSPAAAKAVALEQGWHGRTAAAGAVTWGALEKWYGFPRTPFDVSFAPRDDTDAVGAHHRLATRRR